MLRIFNPQFSSCLVFKYSTKRNIKEPRLDIISAQYFGQYLNIFHALLNKKYPVKGAFDYMWVFLSIGRQIITRFVKIRKARDGAPKKKINQY